MAARFLPLMAAGRSVPIAIDIRFRKTERVAVSVHGPFGAGDLRPEAETDFYPQELNEAIASVLDR